MTFLLTKIIKGLTCYLFLGSFYPVCSRVFLRHDRHLAALLVSVRPHGGTGQGRQAFVERLFGEESGSTDALRLPFGFLVVTSVSGPARGESPSYVV